MMALNVIFHSQRRKYSLMPKRNCIVMSILNAISELKMRKKFKSEKLLMRERESEKSGVKLENFLSSAFPAYRCV
jgi:hypothetical protein